MKVIGAVVVGVALTLQFPSGSAQQESIHFVPGDRVAVRRMLDVPPVELVPGVQVRTVVGTTGSFSLADFGPGTAAALHHHTREQTDIGITGEFAVTLDDRMEQLQPGGGFIIPSNVAHSLANKGTGVARVIEFHTIRRPDLVPPRPAMSYPSSPTPAKLSPGQLTQPMERLAAATASQQFWLRGETCVMAWRIVKGGGPPIELQAGRTEHFIYVVRGDLEMRASTGSERLGEGSLVVIPAGAGITLRSAGSGDAAIAQFSPSPSEAPGDDHAVPVEVEPNHKTVFQNENLQAFRVRLNPGQATLMHTHTHDDVAVRLASASITSQGLGQATAMPETSTLGFTTARDNASRPTSHRVRNVGTSTFDVLDVQLLSRPPGPAVDPIAAPAAENTSMRAYRFELASGAEVRHSHQRPYLLIAVTDAQLSVSQSGGEPRQATLRVGDVDWLSVPRAHTIVNRGGDRVMFVEIELK